MAWSDSLLSRAVIALSVNTLLVLNADERRYLFGKLKQKLG